MKPLRGWSRSVDRWCGPRLLCRRPRGTQWSQIPKETFSRCGKPIRWRCHHRNRISKVEGMMPRLSCALALSVVLQATALAQDQRVEVSLLAGWAFSEGVTGDRVVSGDGNVYNRV